MALSNKELCEKIYFEYKEVFDEIFLSVRGEAPASRSKKEKIKSFNITLNQLVANNIISLNDMFKVKYKDQDYEATLAKEHEGGQVQIKIGDDIYNSPSKQRHPLLIKMQMDGHFGMYMTQIIN